MNFAIFNAGEESDKIAPLKTRGKITVEMPHRLLERAQRASGAGIPKTVCCGLELMAASEAYWRLRQFRGRVRFSPTLGELKADR